MIAFLEGILAEKEPTRVVINVGGVGYEALIPLSSYDRLPPEGQPCRLLVCHLVREDAQQLVGFATEAEKRMFNLLVSVTGIGPKLALAALSGLSVRELKAALVEGDTRRLSSISGVGRKTAERMVVELRDKIGAGEALEARAGATEVTPEDLRARDALLALVSLGYKRAEAQEMVMRAARAAGAREVTVEELVRLALGG